MLGLKFVFESSKGGAAPTAEASEYKLFATELSKRLANASMDIAGPGSQLRVKTEEAPLAGRSESTYRYTVIDTIGGGASEIQKNIIARRKLGCPRTSEWSPCLLSPGPCRGSLCSICRQSGRRRAARACWPTTAHGWSRWGRAIRRRRRRRAALLRLQRAPWMRVLVDLQGRGRSGSLFAVGRGVPM